MSLRRNLLSNYLGQGYAAGIGIVMLPVYVRYLGAEAYGLVGFFAMLQAWLQLFDLGLSPTLSRELSRVRAGVADRARVATMVRSTEWLFVGMGIVVAGLIVASAGWIARDWLKPQSLTVDDMRRSVSFMGGVMASRWLVGLYRTGLAGLERMVTLNAAAVAIATIRSVGVVIVFLLGATRPNDFFAYQFGVSVFELAVMAALFYRAFPMRPTSGRAQFGSLRALFEIAGSMAFLSALWIVMNQSDKLVLSWSVDLSRYGFYTVAVTLAAGISLLAAPLNQALQPRFTVLAAQGHGAALTRLYRLSTQATAATMFAIAGTMTCFALPLLRAWTGNPDAAEHAAPILPLYAIGNTIAALMGIAFLLQFAHGKLRWHVAGNCLFAAVWFPGVWLAARHDGAIGVGWVWLGGNAVYLLGWLPLIHRWLIPGLWWRWLVWDVGAVVAAEAVTFGGLSKIDLATSGRITVGLFLVLVTVAAAVVGLLAGRDTREALLRTCGSLLAPKAV